MVESSLRGAPAKTNQRKERDRHTGSAFFTNLCFNLTHSLIVQTFLFSPRRHFLLLFVSAILDLHFLYQLKFLQWSDAILLWSSVSVNFTFSLVRRRKEERGRDSTMESMESSIVSSPEESRKPESPQPKYPTSDSTEKTTYVRLQLVLLLERVVQLSLIFSHSLEHGSSYHVIMNSFQGPQIGSSWYLGQYMKY